MYGAQFSDRFTYIALDGVLQTPDSGDSAPTDLWLAVPPPREATELGQVLRSLRETGIVVHGFVDRAAVLCSWLRLSGSVVVVDVAPQNVSLSVVEGDGANWALRRTVLLPGGATQLHDEWLQLAARTLVQQTRFDPLHNLQHESALRAQLPQLLEQAARDGQGQCMVATGTTELPLSLTRDQFIEAAAAWYQPLSTALQSLAAITGDGAVLVSQTVAGWPGMPEMLAAARFAVVYRAADGAAACAASLLAASPPSDGGAAPYLTRVPMVGNAPPVGMHARIESSHADAQAMATHVVYRGRAVPITAVGLVIGRDPDGAQTLRLPEGVAGLSRRHCTLRHDGARTQLIDHSTHGSFIDGVRVRGRALLTAGTTLRVGTPGVELSLIALGTETH